MHQRLWNRLEKPASGPLCSVPATGCAGMIVAPGSALCRASFTLCFDEPTSLTMHPGARLAAISPAAAPIARVRGRHRVRLLVKAGKGVPLQAAIAAWIAPVRLKGDLRLSVDIDPQSFL